MAENKIQLKDVLLQHGVSVRQFSDMIGGELNMSYQTVARYCRCTERVRLDFLSEYRWIFIDNRLKALGIKWE